MTWLWLLNFAVLQWFTLRLGRVMELLPSKGKHWRRRQVGWTLLHGIVPLTGWWCPYRRLWGRRR